MFTTLTENIGLSSSELRNVFPHHIAFDEQFRILQIGDKIDSFFTKNGLPKTKVIGSHINDFFEISFPTKFLWDWKSLVAGRNSKFHLDLKSTKLSNSTLNLPLRGKLLISDPKTDPQIKTFHAIFLMNLRVDNSEDLSIHGLSIHDISEYSYQRESMLVGENLRSEMALSHQQDNDSKIMTIKNLQEETARTQQMLETKRTFVRYISHEIRTPLNVVMLGLKMIEDAIVKDAPQEWRKHLNSEMISDMKSSCDVAVSTLNDLLLYEKIEGNLLTMEVEEANLYEVLNTVINSFKIQAKSAIVTLKKDISSIDGTYANLDVNKFSQVLRNLLSNSFKFTPEGGTVNVSAEITTLNTEICTSARNIFLRTPTVSSSNSHYSPDKRISNKADNYPNLSDSGSYVVNEFQISSKNKSDGNDMIRSESFESITTFSSEILEQYIANVQPDLKSPILENLSDKVDMNTNLSSLQKKSEYPTTLPSTDLVRRTSTKSTNTSPESKKMTNSEVASTLDSPNSNKLAVVRILVKDTGSGISPEGQQTLFSEFTQIKASQLQKGGGSGLGLWVARNIMEAHGGTIGVHSLGEGHGSTFYVDVPISRIEYNDEMCSTFSQTSSAQTINQSCTTSPFDNIEYSTSLFDEADLGYSFSSKGPEDLTSRTDKSTARTDKSTSRSFESNFSERSSEIISRKAVALLSGEKPSLKSVLIVDDSISNRKMIRRLLEMKTSIKIIDEASDGMKAINKLLEHTSSQLVSYDVIMMDSEMPNMSGPDAVRQIRSIGYQGLIIGVTGNSLKADIDNFTKAGCNHVMIKPLDIDQFISYVQGTFIC